MDAQVFWGVVIVIAMLAATAVVVVKRKRRLRQEERLARMTPAEREHHDATVERAARIDAAVRSEALAKRTANRETKTARRIHDRETRQRLVVLARCATTEGTVILTDVDIRLPGGAFPLTGVTADAVTAGNTSSGSRSTASRILGGAALFGRTGAVVGATARKPTLHDSRELYLNIDGPNFSRSFACHPDDGVAVHQFAAAIREAARNVDTVVVRRQRHEEEATQQLDIITNGNKARVDEATRAVQRARADTARLDRATQALPQHAPPLF